MRLGATGLSGVLGRSLKSRLGGVEWASFEGDVGDPAAVAAWYAGAGRLDGLFHLAAVVPLRQVESDLPRAVRTNVQGTCNVLDAVVKAGGPRPWLFLASTSHVYASSPEPLPETACLGPANAYGATKLQAETWADYYARRHGLALCIGRIFSYSAPEQPESYFVPAIIRKLSDAPRGGRLEIPGIQGTRDFLTPELICRAFEALLERKAAGVYNIGTGHALKLLEIVAAVRARLGREDLVIVPRDEGTLHLRADVSKLRGLGVELRFDLPALMERMIPRAGKK
ncbi:MAG: NAD(P)-dependent oxidoreductase [Elusimicrobia bacterium]|nr:NAD(P)-dependent oxidoreductase [Elusimicrobiota bacterium]